MKEKTELKLSEIVETWWKENIGSVPFSTSYHLYGDNCIKCYTDNGIIQFAIDDINKTLNILDSDCGTNTTLLEASDPEFFNILRKKYGNRDRSTY